MSRSEARLRVYYCSKTAVVRMHANIMALMLLLIYRDIVFTLDIISVHLLVTKVQLTTFS